jgi:hypothetical protein
LLGFAPLLEYLQIIGTTRQRLSLRADEFWGSIPLHDNEMEFPRCCDMNAVKGQNEWICSRNGIIQLAFQEKVFFNIARRKKAEHE